MPCVLKGIIQVFEVENMENVITLFELHNSRLIAAGILCPGNQNFLVIVLN